MTNLRTKGSFLKLYSWLPILILYISVLNEFDFNYLNYYYFSINFPFILIYYFCLKRTESLGYGYIFIAGLFNDTVVGLPLGISSLSYMLICISTAYIRNITIRPNPLKDWFYFLFILSLINSLNYSLLTLFFSFELILMSFLVNTFFTFSLYIVFVSIFKYYLIGIND